MSVANRRRFPLILVVSLSGLTIVSQILQAELKEDGTSPSTPETVVSMFYQAIQAKDKVKARSLLSPNVDRLAFRSTLEDDSDTPSLYTLPFAFEISGTKTSEDGHTAFVNTNLVISDKPLRSTITLIRDSSGRWLITNAEAIGSPGTNLPELTAMPRSAPNRTLLVLWGPADMYLTSPEGTHAGFDPKTKTVVNEIRGVLHYGEVAETLFIEDLAGTWELRVIGNGVGEYALETRLVKTFKDEMVRGTASIGSVDTYLLRYPAEDTAPLEVIRVNN